MATAVLLEYKRHPYSYDSNTVEYIPVALVLPAVYGNERRRNVDDVCGIILIAG